MPRPKKHPAGLCRLLLVPGAGTGLLFATFSMPVIGHKQYLHQLQSWKKELRELKTPAQAQAWLQQVPRFDRVQTSGKIIHVPLNWLRNGLRLAAQGDLPLAAVKQKYLRRLEAQTRQWPLAAKTANAQSTQAHMDAWQLALARRILARPEFSAVHGPDAWDQFKHWLELKLAQLAAQFFKVHIAFGPGGSFTFYGLLLLTALGTAAWGCLRLVRGWRQRRRITPDPILAQPRAASVWAAAQRARNDGDTLAAWELAYLAGREYCARQGWWQFNPAATPREFIASLPGACSGRPLMRTLAEGIEQVRYAGAGEEALKPLEIGSLMHELEVLGCR